VRGDHNVSMSIFNLILTIITLPFHVINRAKHYPALLTIIMASLITTISTFPGTAAATSGECRFLYSQVEKEAKIVGSCSKDRDCTYRSLRAKGDRRTPCPFPVSRKQNTTSVISAMTDYFNLCIKNTKFEDMVEQCPRKEKLVCSKNQCVPCTLYDKNRKCICPRKDGLPCY